MTRSLYLITVFFLLFSCSDDKEIEDQMYERTIAEYKKEGVDLEPFLDNLEAKFIEEGI
ncbi:MAG: hypothetical protein HRT57_04470, partial [Crocinitomicaceae bacterium]|nr:hypothetical protein [Crocinitomicaceae bacterium]